MDDLISREALMDQFMGKPPDYYHSSYIVGEINIAPAVDAVPVVHGRWEPSEKYFGYNKCSVCADCYIDPEWAMNGKWHYCPNCGAKMDLEG